MVRIVFQEVAIHGVRRWTENGKKRQETKKFFQTLNPFNRAADGLPKTRDQIMQELTTQRAKWLSEAPTR